jgi:hypothetical protein
MVGLSSWKRATDAPEDPCTKRCASHYSDSTIDPSPRGRHGLKGRGGSSAVVSVLHEERVGTNHGEKTAHNDESRDQQTNDFYGCEPSHTSRLWTTAGSYHLTRHKISCREPSVHTTQHRRTMADTGSVNRGLARGQLHRLVRRACHFVIPCCFSRASRMASCLRACSSHLSRRASNRAFCSSSFRCCSSALANC